MSKKGNENWNESWKEFVSSSARMILPSPESPNLLSQKLRKLSLPQRVSQRWMASEVRKLVPQAVKLEQAPPLWGVAGLIIGMLIVVGLFILRGTL